MSPLPEAYEKLRARGKDLALPKATASSLAPSQIEFAKKLISRGLLPPNALQAAP